MSNDIQINMVSLGFMIMNLDNLSYIRKHYKNPGSGDLEVKSLEIGFVGGQTLTYSWSEDGEELFNALKKCCKKIN